MHRIQSIIRSSKNLKEQIFADVHIVLSISELVDEMVEAIKAGNKIWFCGNGGSASDAQHLAAELSGRFYMDRKPIAAETLHGNMSYLTAVGNDYSFDDVYARYLEGSGKKGDILIAISTSGNSKNVVKAAVQAKSMDINVVALTGKTAGDLNEQANRILAVPSDETPRIQEAHMMIGHVICELVEDKLFK